MGLGGLDELILWQNTKFLIKLNFKYLYRWLRIFLCFNPWTLVTILGIVSSVSCASLVWEASLPSHRLRVFHYFSPQAVPIVSTAYAQSQNRSFCGYHCDHHRIHCYRKIETTEIASLSTGLPSCGGCWICDDDLVMCQYPQKLGSLVWSPWIRYPSLQLDMLKKINKISEFVVEVNELKICLILLGTWKFLYWLVNSVVIDPG